MKRSIKRSIIRGVAITVFVFAMLWVFSKVSDINLFNAFDPISQALSDFELTDYTFSNLRPDPLVDERIVLVNIGKLSRGQIAQMISIIDQNNPKVIGLDSFFDCEGGLRDTVNCPQLNDVFGNMLLSNAIQEAGNVVLVTKLLQTDSLLDANVYDVYDSMEVSDSIFSKYAHNAYASLPTGASYQEDVKICKTVIPRVIVNGKEELAFAVQMAKLYDSAKVERFLARGNYEEIVNFRGNVEIQDIQGRLRGAETATTKYPVMFYAIDWPQIANGDYIPVIFENSIVIMGYMGDYFGDPSWNDKFFTPLNKKVAGRANPDMFGAVVHANILAMILNEDYVGAIPEWAQWGIAIVACFLNILLFSVIDRKLPIWFDALSVVLQIIQIIFASLLIVYFFDLFTVKLDLSLTLGVLAVVGPCFDIFKSFEREVEKRFTKPNDPVLSE